jgi:primosomal protein N' (replication factor Y)
LPQKYAIVALEPSYGKREPAAPGESELPVETDPALGLLLHYHIPAYLEGRIEPGHLVVVPLRGTPTYGVVVDLADSTPVEHTKPITRMVDERPVLPPAMLELARWIAEHYRCTLWQAIAPMLPPGVARRAVTTISLAAPLAASESNAAREENQVVEPLMVALGRRQKQVVSLLQKGPRKGMTLAHLKRSYKGASSGLDTALRGLEQDGLVTRRVELPSPRSRPRQERIIRLAVPDEVAYEALGDASQRAPLQAAALDWLLKRSSAANAAGSYKPYQVPQAKEHDTEDDTFQRGWQRLSDLYLHTGATSATVNALERKGLIELGERAVHRRPVANITSTFNDEPPTLTAAQSTAWREIAAALRGDEGRRTKDEGDNSLSSFDKRGALWAANYRPSSPRAFLLHGVTGSGKTELYLRAIGMALRMGRQAIVLVPEISLTPQAVHRFATRFPGRVALIHSQLSPGQQFDEWRRIRDGHADIVVGSRSAVFAPLPRLGLVVVDEEHEWAYKQQDHSPRYHARDVALRRAALTGAITILGSATPDLATYYAAQRGEYRLLSLPTRVGRRKTRDGVELITELPMPPVQVVDMRAELRAGNESLFSRQLQSALDTVLARNEQAILYLNRRGSSSFILCRECGHVPMCPRCDVPLVYHADVHGMLCHRCNAYSLTPRECPKCGSPSIKGFGTGTQKVVDEVAALFPRARVLRWDRDTASRQGGHADMMEMFTRGDADVLVGTQMIAKGLDIARVTLVGVISADTGLFLPDFRAPERSLQLLMQVAGRAGRRTESSHSRVIVQTFNPDHYAIQAAAAHDYTGFYKGEIRFRAEHGYPPYGRLARLVYSSPSNEHCEQAANALARFLRHKVEEFDAADTGNLTDVLGPAPCFVHKIRNRYRWQILLRGDDLSPVLQGLHLGAGWSLDVDPISVL